MALHKILVVDDDKITHSFVKRALGLYFDLLSTYSGAEALNSIKQYQPNLVLLDVEMPGMNGYEVCEQFKSDPVTAEIPVVFLSARSGLRERMQGFEAGADDYIVKPFQPEELKAKINVLLQYWERRKKLVSEVEEARKTAFIAISSSSDLGQAITFIEKTHTISSYDQLASAFFNAIQAMELKCSLMIRTPNGNEFFSSTHNSVRPIESELMESLSTEKRFFDFDCRTQINYPHISLLIKNMPLNDMERYGRIKDFFPAMLSTADIKISQISSQIAIGKQLEETHKAFAEITVLLDTIKTAQESSHKQSVKVMRNMLMELDKKLPHMGLEEDQEQYILDRVDRAIEEAHSTIANTEQINASFRAVLERLKLLLTEQQHLQEQFLIQTEDKLAEEDDGYQMDVELF